MYVPFQVSTSLDVYGNDVLLHVAVVLWLDEESGRFHVKVFNSNEEDKLKVDKRVCQTVLEMYQVMAACTRYPTRITWLDHSDDPSAHFQERDGHNESAWHVLTRAYQLATDQFGLNLHKEAIETVKMFCQFNVHSDVERTLKQV